MYNPYHKVQRVSKRDLLQDIKNYTQERIPGYDYLDCVVPIQKSDQIRKYLKVNVEEIGEDPIQYARVKNKI